MNSVYSIWNDFFWFFLEMAISTSLFRRWPTLWNSTLRRITLFRRCSYQRWNIQHWFDLVRRCKSQRWNIQCCFNVDLTLSHVATSYQPKNNVETTLICLLGNFSLLFLTCISYIITESQYWQQCCNTSPYKKCSKNIPTNSFLLIRIVLLTWKVLNLIWFYIYANFHD